MNGDSGLDSIMTNFDNENDQLTQMQSYMTNQSRNLLNKEMVRSAAYFGFGQRPEPKDLPAFNPDEKKSPFPPGWPFSGGKVPLPKSSNPNMDNL